MARREREPPPVYECRPPTWLPKVHTEADLGYVGFYPPRPDQEEEVLTDGNVKNGLHQVPFVPLETYSAREPILGRLVTENALIELEDLMNQIFVRKTEDSPSIAPSSFRLPSRVTLNDAKRQAWFADLANPNVPLQKLGKSVPHGAKGHDLLDLLHENKVAIPRAVWFLRVFGGNETVGLRNKPHYNPTQYSVDWATLVVGYLRKQLTQIALPMAPRPGLNVKQPFKGVLAEATSRENWLSRFTYSLNLLRVFYAEGLVDNRTFLLWLVEQMATCNLAQLGFIARIAEEYLDGMVTCRALAGPFVEYTLCRLSEIKTTPGSEHLGSMVHLLQNILLRALLALPDAFVNPRIWAQHSTILDEALMNSGLAIEQTTQALHQTFIEILADVRRRNDAMLFRELPPRVVGHLSSALSDIKLLNSLSGQSDLGAVVFFDPSPAHLPSFPDKLDILLTWSITSLQHGDHRPYAAVSLLRYWRNQEEERAIRRGRDGPDDFIQDQLFDWLDASDIAADPANLNSVALVFGQLVKQGLFSYPRYIQRLIARGEQGLDSNKDHESRHRSFVRWIPLYDTSSSLIAQRKVTLYGARARETPEDTNERAIRKKIRLMLPELFNGSHPTIDLSHDICSMCDDLFSATRFEQVRLMHGWLLPLLKKWISSRNANASFDASDPALQVYCVATTLLARCRSYGTMLELALFTLEHTSTKELLEGVLRTLRQHIEVWACMDKLQSITSALYTSHHIWRTRGLRSRPLMRLLIELDDGRLLSELAREQVINDFTAFSYALRPTSDQPQELPATLPEILLLATDDGPDAPVALANSLWYNYRSTPNWDRLVWDNTVSCLRQLPFIIEDEVTRKACSYKYAMFLRHVDQHLPDGFDDSVLSWFLDSGLTEVVSFSTEIWDELAIILLYLSIHGALATTTILTGLIYPIWRSASSLSNPQDGTSLELQLSAANKMFDHLLLRETCADGFPPSDLYEIQGLQTRRRDVFRHPHFIALAENIPTLVLIEHNSNLSSHLRDDSRLLREALCTKSVFRLGIYRDLETVHRAFESALENHNVPEELHEPLIDALKVMFSEDRDSSNSCIEQWQILSTSLTPWKLAATSIELRFTIKQLEEALARDSLRDKARLALNRITSSLFKQGMCSEEVDFVTGIVKGGSVEIVARFVNAGLQRISEILKAEHHPRNSLQYANIASKTGEVLRFLTSIADSCREEVLTSGQTVPFDAQAQEDLIFSLQQELVVIEDSIKATRNESFTQDDLQAISHALILFTRIIQFTLGFPALWTSKSRSESEKISVNIFNLALLFSSGPTLDSVIFPLLIDTLYYLLDEIPADPKATSYEPMKKYPKYDLQQLPPDIPGTYRSCLRTLLPFVSLNASVDGLAYVASDNDTTPTPVQNHPWEWMEYLGEPSTQEVGDEGAVAGTVKNTTSLSLELFNAHALAKRSADVSSDNPQATLDGQRVLGTLSELRETSFLESIFKRDWRESRVFVSSPLQGSTPSHPEAEDEAGPLPGLISTDRRSISSRMASPVSSIRSRGSVQPPGSSSMRHSPSQPQPQHMSTSGSTASDAIDVDNLNADTFSSMSQTQSNKKRKTTDDVDGDDVQVVYGPSTSQKKLKSKTGAAKSKPKRQ